MTEDVVVCENQNHVDWRSGRMKRFYWTIFVVGAGIGSVATSLGFGFLLT